MLEGLLIFNGLTMNDQSKSALNVSPFYWIEVKQADGLFSSDVSYESHPIPGAIGEKSGDVYRRGKTITVSGEVKARTLRELRIAERDMQHAFWDCLPHQLRYTLWGEAQVYVTCRTSQDLAIVEVQEDLVMRRRFVVALRADDPRSYKVSDNSLFPTWQT